MYLWASAVPGHVTVNMMPNVSMKTIYEWYQVCKDVTERNLRETQTSSAVLLSTQVLKLMRINLESNKSTIKENTLSRSGSLSWLIKKSMHALLRQ